MPATPIQILFSLHFVCFFINEACISLRDEYIIYTALCMATNLRYKAAISLLQDEKHIPTTSISIN